VLPLNESTAKATADSPDDASDEINIGQLIALLLSQWRVIVMCAGALAVLGALLGNSRPFTAQVEFRTLGENQLSAFRPLNDFLIREYLQKESDNSPSPPPLSGDLFTNSLIATLGNSAVFSNLAKVSYAQALAQLQDEQQLAYLTQLRGRFTITPPTFNEKRGTGSVFWTIQLRTLERGADVDFLKVWISTANQQAVTGIRESLLKRADSRDLSNTFALEDKKRELAYVEADYEKTIAQKLATLAEQAKIARALGIAQATLEGTTFSGNASVVTNLNADNPMYLRGYKALEQEAKLISERKDGRQFVEDIITLEAAIRELENNQAGSRLRELVQQSPLSDPSFKLVSTDLDILEFSRKIGTLQGGLLGLMAGGLLGVMLALLIPAVRREARRGNATSA
jgi:hypothetical protein